MIEQGVSFYGILEKMGQNSIVWNEYYHHNLKCLLKTQADIQMLSSAINATLCFFLTTSLQ